MTSVRKSPNMMSTTGRRPVIAAPTPRPVMPASEIGESTIRSVPNSSTRPASTLKGVPASATSSPITKTAGSRLNSSASASLTAWANVSVRVSTLSVDIVGHAAGVGEGCVEREGNTLRDLLAGAGCDRLQRVGGREVLLREPAPVQRERVALTAPQLFLVLRPVVRPVDVADVVAVVTVGVAQEKRGAPAAPGPLDELDGGAVHGAHVLSVDLPRLDPEGARSRQDVAGGRLEVVRVLVVLVVLADVDDGQRPERRHVHHLVEEPLPERPLAEEADGDLVGAAPFGGERRAGRDSGRAADDRVRAEVAVLVVGDVHRAALPAAVSGLLAEELGEHAAHLRALREAVPVPAMRRRDPVVAPKSRADADCDRLLTDVEMRQAGHLGAAVELVRLLLEEADQHHSPVHLEREIRLDVHRRRGPGHADTSVFTPDIAASTSNSTAKSFSPTPVPFAAVSSSFVTAVVGSGTSSSRPSSSARFRSFCIMRQSNHASSGCSSTKGPR